jgi:hypothetical protein
MLKLVDWTNNSVIIDLSLAAVQSCPSLASFEEREGRVRREFRGCFLGWPLIAIGRDSVFLGRIVCPLHISLVSDVQASFKTGDDRILRIF